VVPLVKAEDRGCSSVAAILDWHEGETLYSWCARTHLGYGFNDRASALALFGRQGAFKEHELPSGVTALVERTRGLIGSADQIVQQRTILAAYLPFLKPRDAATLIKHVANKTRCQPVAIMGLHSAQASALHALRFCRACADESINLNGYAPWLLNSQLPGVWVCPIHECALMHLVGRQGGWALPNPKATYPAIARSASDVKTLLPLTQLAQAIVGRRVDNEVLRRKLAALACQNFPRALTDPVAEDRIRLAWTQSKLAVRLQREEALRPLVLDVRWMIELLQRSVPTHPFQWMLCWAFLTADWKPSAAVAWFLECGRWPGARAQLDLWEEGREALPFSDEVETALAMSKTRAEIAKSLHVGRRRLDRWFEDTPALKARWLELRCAARQELALKRCEEWLTRNSHCGLSQFYVECLVDIEWLSKHQLAVFMGLRGRIPNRRGQQKFLPGLRPPDANSAERRT
jgi:hypothetical protein